MRLSYTLILLHFAFAANSQISVSKTVAPEISVKKYDSTYNYNDDLKILIGQDLYLLPVPNYLGYNYYNEIKSDSLGRKTAFPIVGQRTKNNSDSVAGRTYKFISLSKPFVDVDLLKMKDLKSGRIVYYKRHQNLGRYDWPYVVQGYFEKLEKNYKNKIYVSRTSKYLKVPNTADSIKIDIGDTFTVESLTLLAHRNYQYGAVITNANGKEMLIHKSNIDNALTLENAKNYKSKYPSFYQAILENKIKIGMPKAALILSWGEPDEINSSSYTDQWVYGNQYVYLENGKVKAWN